MFRLIVLALMALLALTACGPQPGPFPTGPGDPTPVIQTAAPGSDTDPTPAPATPAVTSAPLATPAPQATPVDVVPFIAILAPGPTSIVLSPVRVAGSVTLLPENRPDLRIQILDNNDVVIGETTVTPDPAENSTRGTFEATVAFEIPSGEQAGRIAVSTLAQTGDAVTALAAIEVTLSTSRIDIVPGKDPGRPFTLNQPAPGSSLSGGAVDVGGIGYSLYDNDLTVEIRDAADAVVGQASFTIDADATGVGPYGGPVTYTVASAGPGRIVVYDRDATGQITSLSSIPVTLAP